MKVDFIGTKTIKSYYVTSYGFLEDHQVDQLIVFKTIEEASQQYFPGDEVYFPEEDITLKIRMVAKIYPTGYRYMTDYRYVEEDKESLSEAIEEIREIRNKQKENVIKPDVKPKRWWNRRKTSEGN